jgi:hypothetical protein
MTIRTEKLEGLKYWYDQRARAFVGEGFVEMAMTVPGAAFVLEVIEDMEKRAASNGRRLRVAELGTGFSTVFVGSWMINDSEYCGELWSMDHNLDWLAFMRVIGVDLGLVQDRFLPREKFIEQAPKGTFDVAIVDHGPQLQTRADDMPWVAELMNDQGVMLFDDWRPKHEGRIRRALGSLGGWAVSTAEHTRRYPKDKAIGVARRSA